MMSDEQNNESDEQSAPTPPVPPTVPEGARTHSAADAQPLNVDEYRPEPGTATFKDDRTGEDIELSGEAKGNADLDAGNFEQTFPKRHVTRRRSTFVPESGLELDEVAKQVNEGLWGSGQDRRVLLDRFNYDPNEVQARSVALLNKAKADKDAEQL